MKKETKYQLICRDLREKIDQGILKDKMPSMRDLTAQYKVSHVTILRVFKELTQEGLIENQVKSVYTIKKSKKIKNKLVVCLMRSLRSINNEDNFANDMLIGAGKAAMDKRLDQLYPQQNYLINYHGTSDLFFEEISIALEEYLPTICGFLLHPSFTDEQLEKYFLPVFGHIPSVIVGRGTTLPVHSVEMPTEAGCREAARLTAKSVYSDYILCEISKNTDYRTDHTDIFADELKKNGCDDANIHYCYGISSSIAEDEKAVVNVINMLNKINGKPLVFCSSSRGAHWLNQQLEEHGHRAGRDFGLLAFDGKEYCYNNDPKIATIKVSGEEMGEAAIEILTGSDYQPVRHLAGFKIDINETL